jgi:hypothetical protein
MMRVTSAAGLALTPVKVLPDASPTQPRRDGATLGAAAAAHFRDLAVPPEQVLAHSGRLPVNSITQPLAHAA